MGPFSDQDRKQLESNPNVEKVNKTQVTFTPKFKILALKKYEAGIPPKRIFTDADINLSLFNADFAKKTIYRWRQIKSKHGDVGLKKDSRGKKSRGRPKSKGMSSEQEIALLKAEISILKKLQALAARREK